MDLPESSPPPSPVSDRPVVRLHAPVGAGATHRRRSEPGAAGSGASHLPRANQRTDPANGRSSRLRARPAVRAGHLQAAREPSGSFVHEGNLGTDLRNLQDLSSYAGTVPPN